MSFTLPGKMNAAILIELLKWLISARSKKIVLVIDHIISYSNIIINKLLL